MCDREFEGAACASCKVNYADAADGHCRGCAANYHNYPACEPCPGPCTRSHAHLCTHVAWHAWARGTIVKEGGVGKAEGLSDERMR